MRPSIIATPDEPRDALTSAHATLQHIENLYARAQKLEALRLEAEDQLLHRVGNDYRSGRINTQTLAEIYQRYKQLDLVGRSKRWNEAVPITWKEMVYASRWCPNGPAGTWVGPWPIDCHDPTPPPGATLVYILFDAANEPIYVGSTGDFRGRLKAHARDGKPFVRWQAHAVKDREAAYELEVRLLKEKLPPMNKKAGR